MKIGKHYLNRCKEAQTLDLQPLASPITTSSNPLPEYAFFSQSTSISLQTFGEGIPFLDPAIMTSAFLQDRSNIRIIKSGIYKADIVIIIPELTTVDTIFRLQLEQTNTSGTSICVKKTSDHSTYAAFTQCIFEVDDMTSLRLSSTQMIHLLGEPDETLVSLSIVKIG